MSHDLVLQTGRCPRPPYISLLVRRVCHGSAAAIRYLIYRLQTAFIASFSVISWTDKD